MQVRNKAAVNLGPIHIVDLLTHLFRFTALGLQLLKNVLDSSVVALNP